MKKNLFKSFAVSILFIFCVACSNTNQVDLKLIPVKSGEKWGYINKKGEYIINPQFQNADFFHYGLAKVVSSDGKIGYIKEDGKYAIPAKFKSGTNFSEGLAFVVSDGSYPVCIDKSGGTIFSLKQAKYAVSFSEGLAIIVNTEGKFGFVDKTGKMIINPQFESANSFSEGLAVIKQNDKYGFIDKTGKIVINTQFEEVSDFKNGKARFKNGKQWGYIDTKGAYIINPQFDAAGFFSEGMAIILQGSNYGYISEKGEIIINPQFEDAGEFNSSLACVKSGETYGYINKDGKFEINPQFEKASSFFKDIAFVKTGDKWGVIDKEGKYIINPQFDAIKYYFETSSYVQSDYYDATTFIKKFFEKSGDNNSFDGFDANSTLQNIIDNTLYSNVNSNYEYIVYTNDHQEITNEISIEKTQFHFINPVFIKVENYDYYYGYRYENGTSKQYKFSEKFATIEYQFDLTGEANGKGGAVANALKTELEKKYNSKMETADSQYTFYKDNGLSFGITYNDYSCSFYVSFNKENLQNLLMSNEEEYVEEVYVD